MWIGLRHNVLFVLAAVLGLFVGYCTPTNSASYYVGCTEWDLLISDLNAHLQTKDLLCERDAACSGISCMYSNSGYRHEFYVSVNVKASICGNEPIVRILIDAPLLGIFNLTRVLLHDEMIEFPFGTAVMFELHALAVNVTVHSKEDEIVLGASIIGQSNASLRWKTVQQLTVEHRIPLNSCEIEKSQGIITSRSAEAQPSIHRVGLTSSRHLSSIVSGAMRSPKKCNPSSLESLTECDEKNHELCSQHGEDPRSGECECEVGFAMRDDGKCIKNLEPTKSSPTDPTDLPHKADRVQSTSGSTVALTVVLSLMLICLLAGVAYVSVRFRLCHRFRWRAFGIRTGGGGRGTILVEGEEYENGSAAIA